jgi:hypothetical protein
MGDNLPSDFLIRVQPGGFYGWPYTYIGKHPMPGFAQLVPEKVEESITPDLLLTAHSSLLDLVFYEGDQFPAEYKGSLFVALKGSWNRSLPTRYKIVRVPFKDGRPEGWYKNFATGFWASGEQRAEVWGRPAASRSPRTARCSSPTTPAALSGASPTSARLRGRARRRTGGEHRVGGQSPARGPPTHNTRRLGPHPLALNEQQFLRMNNAPAAPTYATPPRQCGNVELRFPGTICQCHRLTLLNC